MPARKALTVDLQAILASAQAVSSGRSASGRSASTMSAAAASSASRRADAALSRNQATASSFATRVGRSFAATKVVPSSASRPVPARVILVMVAARP